MGICSATGLEIVSPEDCPSPCAQEVKVEAMDESTVSIQAGLESSIAFETTGANVYR